MKGFLLLFIVVSTIGIGVLALQPLFSGNPCLLAVLFNLYLLFSALSAKTLRVEVEKVEACLDKGDLNASRVQVGYLVGRDTAELNEEEIIKAAVENTVENTIDGVLAPLFFMFLGLLLPVPWLNPALFVMVYKCVNTLDSMLGTFRSLTGISVCFCKMR